MEAKVINDLLSFLVETAICKDFDPVLADEIFNHHCAMIEDENVLTHFQRMYSVLMENKK